MFYNANVKFSKGVMLALLVFWFGVSVTGLVDPLFVPSPLDVAGAFLHLLAKGDIFYDILVTLGRVFAGFVAAVVLSVVTAVFIFINPVFKSNFEHLVGLIRYIPIPALIPLIILWFGIGEVDKIVIVFLSINPYLTLLIVDHFKEIPKEIIENAVLAGIGTTDLVLKVLLPYSLPRIIDSTRVATAGGWAAIALAEIVGANAGIGHMIVEAKRFTQTAKLFVGILLFGVFGLATDWGFKKINERFTWARG